MTDGPGRPGKYAPGMGTLMSLAFEFAAIVLLLWLAGRWLDGRWGTDPWVQVAAVVFGWVGATLHVIYGARRFEERDAGAVSHHYGGAPPSDHRGEGTNR